MLYKRILYLFIFFIISNCTTKTLNENQIELISDNVFTNKGFALIYSENLFNKKKISKKLEQRGLIIFQKNLKKDSSVKITNINNKKTLIAKVGKDALYPAFNNSVISTRIANELDLNLKNPYVEIKYIPKDGMFVAKRAKTYDEEKQVANKAPVDGISINDLKTKIKKNKDSDKLSNKFSYNIKIADFYYKTTALLMIDRIKFETKVTKPKILKISEHKYRVYLGPFKNINSLKKNFDDIRTLEFENIEIIRND